MAPELITSTEAARRLNVDRNTIYGWCENGTLKFVRTPGGHRRIVWPPVESDGTPLLPDA